MSHLGIDIHEAVATLRDSDDDRNVYIFSQTGGVCYQ